MTDLSPAAQAVLNAAINVAESPDAEAIAAVAIRCAAGYLFPKDTAQQCYDRILAIATELEGVNG
jgi:hypothetical protein